MLNLNLILITVAITILSVFGFGATGVYAQDFCDTFPQLCGVTGNSGNPSEQDSQNYVFSRVGIVISLALIGITITGIYVIVKAGYKYISSQGNGKQISESSESIRNVFIGIALLFVGLIGIILALSFFGGESFLNPTLTLDQLLRPGR